MSAPEKKRYKSGTEKRKQQQNQPDAVSSTPASDVIAVGLPHLPDQIFEDKDSDSVQLLEETKLEDHKKKFVYFLETENLWDQNIKMILGYGKA